MITLINYRSTIEEINTTTTSILNSLLLYDFSTDQYLLQIIKDISSLNLKMTETLKEEIVRSTLAPLDDIRDKSARVIFLEIKAKLLWPDKDIVEAAKEIQKILDNYGMEMLNMSYSAESANINALLNDLKKTKLAPVIEKLHGFNTLIVQLEKDQKIFEVAFQEYIARKAEQSKMLSAGKLADMVKNQINRELNKYLDVMATVKPEIYAECTNKIETIIRDNNAKVKARISKLKEKEEV